MYVLTKQEDKTKDIKYMYIEHTLWLRGGRIFYFFFFCTRRMNNEISKWTNEIIRIKDVTRIKIQFRGITQQSERNQYF